MVVVGGRRPFHPSVPSSVPSSNFLIPGWKRRTTTTNGDRNNFIQMRSAKLTHEPVDGEELGPLRAMTAAGAGLSSSTKRTLETSLAFIFLRKKERYLRTNCAVAGMTHSQVLG